MRRYTHLQESEGDRENTRATLFTRRSIFFIYNTWCWQGVSSSASILQVWSARLRMYCTVFGNQDCSGTINTRLKQQTLSLFFLAFLHFFLQNGTNNNTKYLCCWQFTKEVFWLDNCAILFSAFFSLLHLKLCKYGTPEFLLDCSLRHAGCTLLKLLYGYCSRTHLPIIKKRHAKSSNCTVTVCLT